MFTTKGKRVHLFEYKILTYSRWASAFFARCRVPSTSAVTEITNRPTFGCLDSSAPSRRNSNEAPNSTRSLIARTNESSVSDEKYVEFRGSSIALP